MSLHIYLAAILSYRHVCSQLHVYADNDGDLCLGRIAQTLCGPAIDWVSCGSGSSGGLLKCSDPHYKQRWSWYMKMRHFNLMQWYYSDCIFPPSLGKEPSTALANYARGIWFAQLGLQIPCAVNGSECMCYVNSVELTNAGESEVEDGDFLWCLHASPDMGREIEILSVASPSLTSVEEDVGPAMPELAAPQGLIGSAHYCQRA